MTELHFPWLEFAILTPLVGAVLVSRLRSADAARHWSLIFFGVTLAFTAGAWFDFGTLDVLEADDLGHLPSRLFHHEIFVIDQLSAPLLPLTALQFFLTTITTVRAQSRRFSFAGNLLSLGILLAMLSCKEPIGVITLLIISTIPPYLELRSRQKSTRVYVIHMLLFIVLLVTGWIMVEREGSDQLHTLWAIVPLLGAIFIRSGIVPVHCWMTDLFENASFGSALLFVTPLTGAYAAVRLLLPIAPDWVMRSIGLVSLITAVYAGGMALVQRDARRFFCYLFLSHSALVLVGLEAVTPIGLTGALCVWLTVGMSLGGFGLTLRALEGRRGRLQLTGFQGMYDHAPDLAVCFLLTGLASVGFPGMAGFVGAELLVDGVVEAYPFVGMTVVLAAALDGIAVVKAYFVLFTGSRHVSSISLSSRPRLRFAMLSVATLVLVGGWFPQPGVKSRYDAAAELLRERWSHGLGEPQDLEGAHGAHGGAGGNDAAHHHDAAAADHKAENGSDAASAGR